MGVGDRPWVLRGAVIGLALAVGLVAWLATRGGDEEAQPATPGFEARIVDEDELADIAADSGHAVYWAGPRPDTELEASEGPDGGVQVRYLEEGVEPGERPAAFLTVGSYPLPDPGKALDGYAQRPGATVRRSREGRRVVIGLEAPSSAYFVSPDNDVQVEVYDRSPKRALRVALSDRVRPVG